MANPDFGKTGEDPGKGLLHLNEAELAKLKKLADVGGSLLEASEINLLRVIGMQGIGLKEAINTEQQYPEYFDFGTGWDGMKALQKFTDLGFIRYDYKLNKWVSSLKS